MRLTLIGDVLMQMLTKLMLLILMLALIGGESMS